MMRIPRTAALALIALPVSLRANEPVTSYMFPPGGQRGTTVDARVGGLFLHGECAFEMRGPGVEAPPRIRETTTTWFEGPVIPLPASQRAEDYPKDHAAQLKIAADAPLGVRYWRVSTSQGATPALKFVVGELPEVVEQEIEGEPIAVPIALPVTINGRIFPREDVDSWSLALKQRQTVQAEVHAARLGSPLDSRLEVLDPQGRRLAENGGHFGADAFLQFTAPANGVYQIRIHDLNFEGLQHYVYRLTLTAGPYVDSVYPLGGRRGSELKLELGGTPHGGTPHGGTPLSGVTHLAERGATLTIPIDAADTFAHRFTFDDQKTNEILLDVDDLPEHLETEPNNTAEQAAKQNVPAVLNGRIGQPGDVDLWAFTAAKGTVYDLDLRAGRLGSPLDSVLSIADANGKELARSDDLAGDQTDSFLKFTAPADGVYRLQVEERLRSRGGPRYAYRLRIGPAAKPDFRLALPTDALSLARGGEVKLKLNAERLGGFNEAITLEFEGLPAGVTASASSIAAKQNQVQLVLKAEATAKVQAVHLKIRGSAEIDGQKVAHLATLPTPRGLPEIEDVLLAVAMPTPFKVVGTYNSVYAPRGSVYRRRYTIDRGGFEGPLEIKLADRQARHLQGVTGPTVAVPAGASEFEYPALLSPFLEVGRTSRTVIMAVGTVTDEEGRQHVVSQSTPNQNEQIVILTDPGLLSVQPDRTSLVAQPNSTVELPVRIDRAQHLKLPVTVELIVPAHMRGVEAAAVTIPANQNRGTLAVRFGSAMGPFNTAVVVRATATDRGDPVVAESKIELVP